MSTINDYRLYWGKAKAYAQGSVRWHPAVYHMLDVAAVFAVLFDHYRPTWLDPRLKHLLVLLTALHDIGKITRSFQGGAAEFWPVGLLGEYQASPRTARHDTLGYLIIRSMLVDELERLWPGSDYHEHWDPLVRASSGHHGTPPIGIETRVPPVECCNTCQSHIRGIFLDFVDLLCPAAEIAAESPATTEKEIIRTHWWFAGMVNLSDWLGSVTGWFKAQEPCMSLRDYWALTLKQVAEAVRGAGVQPSAIGAERSFTDLFGYEKPNPVQRWCATVALPPGGKIVFIEDETGSGKTEAAFALAHRMMVDGDGRGIFCALPTMATANQMYDRASTFYRKFFAPGETPSLSLPHGKSFLNADYRASIVRVLGQVPESTERPEPDADNAECAGWIADDKRRALLADVGIGTIDQALLAVLRCKYAPLRLLGIAGKVLIIDEAHAYDAYMLEILKKLLEFHARLGGSAIILSATLPLSMRNELAGAFRHGLGIAPPEPLSGMAYPLITVASADTAIEAQPAAKPGGKPRVRRGKRWSKQIEIVDDYDRVLQEIERAVAAGAKVAWVRNTVEDAVNTSRLLRARGVRNVTLFHSHFVAGDRNDIENCVLRSFDKASKRSAKQGEVLIATQVIEQSLDIDFDLMVSDPAPLDLLLQRLGRLWRHRRRTRRLAHPRFIIASPLPLDDPPANWLFATRQGDLSAAGGQYVYRDVALLWRSVRIMQAEGVVGDLARFRPMVEAAYTASAFAAYSPDFIPIALRPAEARTTKQKTRDRWAGDNATLDFDEGYVDGQWLSEDVVRTRLTRPTVDLRLAVLEGETLTPIYAAPDGVPPWALSEVTSSDMRLLRLDCGRFEHLVEHAKRHWKPFEQQVPLIPLVPAEDGWFRARVLCGDQREACTVSYHRRVGFQVD